MVVDYQTVRNFEFLVCFVSGYGKWMRKQCRHFIGMDSWEMHSVFEFGDRLVWFDLSVGITVWDEDPFESVKNNDEKALCRFVSLPEGCRRVDNRLKQDEMRLVCGGGGFIQFLEVVEGGDEVLKVWRLVGFGLCDERWSLVYNVGRGDFERCGLGKELPCVWFGHPFEGDVGFVKVGEYVYLINFRTRMVDTKFRFRPRRCFPVVVPSWPASVPLSLYAAYAKERGNQCYKDQNFVEAIKSYSKSISLLPNALAFANRAMAYIKVGSFREAEEDCTKALNLDNNYVKLYGRRAVARKELGNLEGCLKDIEYALKLEPKNQQMIKQYDDIKSMIEKTSTVEYDHEGPACNVHEDDKKWTD